MTTLYVTHPACLDHLVPSGHPERPDRLRAIDAALKAPSLAALRRRMPEGVTWTEPHGGVSLLLTLPDLIDAELAHRGYAVHTVTPERWLADYRIVDDARSPTAAVATYARYAVEAGTNTVAIAST